MCGNQEKFSRASPKHHAYVHVCPPDPPVVPKMPHLAAFVLLALLGVVLAQDGGQRPLPLPAGAATNAGAPPPEGSVVVAPLLNLSSSAATTTFRPLAEAGAAEPLLGNVLCSGSSAPTVPWVNGNIASFSCAPRENLALLASITLDRTGQFASPAVAPAMNLYITYG
jgi:hypothetical protein